MRCDKKLRVLRTFSINNKGLLTTAFEQWVAYTAIEMASFVAHHIVGVSDDVAPRAIEHRGMGVVLLLQALDPAEQNTLLQDCLTTLQLNTGAGVQLDGRPSPQSLWSYQTGWLPGQDEQRTGGGEVSQSPPACLESAAQLLDRLAEPAGGLNDVDAREADPQLHLAPLLGSLVFKRVWARLYAGPTALGWHNDPDTGISGWVCLINLGADATFVWRRTAGDAAGVQRARLRSGDAILFNGHVLQHAVEAIHEETCPQFWRNARMKLPDGSDLMRVGLQMRH
jgi:hypothetical protein